MAYTGSELERICALGETCPLCLNDLREQYSTERFHYLECACGKSRTVVPKLEKNAANVSIGFFKTPVAFAKTSGCTLSCFSPIYRCNFCECIHDERTDKACSCSVLPRFVRTTDSEFASCEVTAREPKYNGTQADGRPEPRCRI